MKNNLSLPAMVLGAMCFSAVPLAAIAAEAPAAGSSAAPPSPAAVVNMVNNCYTCHGTDGRSPGSIPSLTGKNADQVLLMLKEYKSGRLASTVMTRQAKGYTDAELEAMANYIANNLK
jgi:cytochrome subunit of sulfide dehydrogenase